MAENCDHDCASCSQNCSSRDPKSLLKQPHALSKIKKVIAVVSGKGGVGKSMTSALLACAAMNKGYVTAIMDADITGPSIPKMFGVHERAMGTEAGILPVLSRRGMQIMSMNVLLDSEEAPVVWRGALISGTVLQFWTDVIWADVDYMFIDMPPGTGDVPLTIFQSIPLDGIVIVTTPQDLVGMIVKKAVNMASMMNVPILGIVENMSYVACPDCGRKIEVFGPSKADAIALEHGITNVLKVPVDLSLTAAADGGRIEEFAPNYCEPFFGSIDEAVRFEEWLNERDAARFPFIHSHQRYLARAIKADAQGRYVDHEGRRVNLGSDAPGDATMAIFSPNGLFFMGYAAIDRQNGIYRIWGRDGRRLEDVPDPSHRQGEGEGGKHVVVGAALLVHAHFILIIVRH